MPDTRFSGFPPGAMPFFEALGQHQDRAWFAANKATYEAAVRAPLATLVTALSARLATAKIPLRGDPDTSLFRVNRDVRFGADKRPYNTHASAVLTRDGTKRAQGVLYIQIGPAGSFAAVGFFRPEPTVLQALRAGLADKPRAWTVMERALAARALPLVRDDALVRPPKGFDAATPDIADALRLKSWIVRRDLDAGRVRSAALLDDLASLAKDALPLLRFGWAALEP